LGLTVFINSSGSLARLLVTRRKRYAEVMQTRFGVYKQLAYSSDKSRTPQTSTLQFLSPTPQTRPHERSRRTGAILEDS
jgi:hypothetical protein